MWADVANWTPEERWDYQRVMWSRIEEHQTYFLAIFRHNFHNPWVPNHCVYQGA